MSLRKLREFRSLLNTLEETEICLAYLMKRKDDFKSRRLKALLTFDTDGGLIPANYKKEIEAFG